MGIFSFVTCIYVVLCEQALVLIIQHRQITKDTIHKTRNAFESVIGTPAPSICWY